MTERMKFSRELLYKTVETAVVNMFLDLKEYMPTMRKNGTV